MKNDLQREIMKRELCSRKTVRFDLAAQERAFTDQSILFASPAVEPRGEPGCNHECGREEQRTLAGGTELVCSDCGAVAACIHCNGITSDYEGGDVVFRCELAACLAVIQRRRRGTV